MPLLDEGTRLSDAQLDELIRDHRTAIRELCTRLEDPDFAVTRPLSIRTAIELGRDTERLFERAQELVAARAGKLAVVNVAYDVMLAIIDLMKMHSDLPKVPRES